MTVGIPEVELKHLYRLEASLDTKMEIGNGPYGFRRCVTIAGGKFEGDRFKGEVLYSSRNEDLTTRPGGADHMIVGTDQTAYVDTRYNLKTHDGAYIYIRTRGVRSGPADVLDGLLAGEEVDPHRYDFHFHAFLETGDERYWWLNKAVIVGRAIRSANGIAMDAYEVVTKQP